MTTQNAGDNPAGPTVAALAVRLGELTATRDRLHREAADLRSAFQRRAAQERSSAAQPAPFDPRDPGRDYRTRGERAARERALREEEDAMRVAVDDLRRQADEIGVQHAETVAALAALRRLDALDALVAATAEASRLLAEAAAATGARRAALHQEADAALGRRRAAFIVWRTEFNGSEIPALTVGAAEKEEQP